MYLYQNTKWDYTYMYLHIYARYLRLCSPDTCNMVMLILYSQMDNCPCTNYLKQYTSFSLTLSFFSHCTV